MFREIEVMVISRMLENLGFFKTFPKVGPTSLRRVYTVASPRGDSTALVKGLLPGVLPTPCHLTKLMLHV